MSPNNPFSNAVEERIAYSKTTGSLELTSDTNPVNIFKFVKRSNRTINNETSAAEVELETSHKELFKIISILEPSIVLKIPSSAHRLDDYLKGQILVQTHDLDFDEEEQKQIDRALLVLRSG